MLTGKGYYLPVIAE